ncbi:MAG: hypothetical protein E7613_06715 [Ruminococcaceae bacterium]|nr:hypothetical protein [Oscillospiraceae bacterium]
MQGNFRTVIDKFLGLHECEAGETRLKKGESPLMKNLRVTQNYTLLRREGFRKVSSKEGEGRGLYIGKNVFWVVSDSVYMLDGDTEYMIGTLESSSGEVTVFEFDGKVYFLDGKRIKKWDGAVFSDLSPYVPLVAISCTPDGAGTPFEEVNLLTGKKRQSFTPDGSSTVFYLTETNIDKVDSVKLFGEKILRSKYTVNLEKGSVTFHEVPENTYPNCLEITYTKESGSEGDIHRMRYAMAYGGVNDIRVFLWGDSDYPAHVRYSGVYDGISGMEYFPELNFNKVGSGGRVTSLVRHYDGLMVFTENEAFGCTGETLSDANGKEYTVYPMRTLSSQAGCGAPNFAKLIANTPITLCPSGLYKWSSSTIRDERNAIEIGERIRRGLGSFDMERVRSFDRASTSELYIWQGERVYVYSYSLDVFYYYEGFDAVAFAEDREGGVWFLKRDGTLCILSDNALDGEEAIDFVWESGYEEHSGLDTKNVHSLEFEVYPIKATRFGFDWMSERLTGGYGSLEIDYRITDFENLCFDSFVFATSVAPVRLYKRIKAKRTRGFKVRIKNDGDSFDFHLLSLAVEGRLIDTK